jgi:hypothetical protein
MNGIDKACEKALVKIGILAKTAIRYNAAGRRDVMQKILDIATEAQWIGEDELAEKVREVTSG